MFEVVAPYLRVESGFDLMNFRFPMFLVSIAIVILWQFFKKSGSPQGNASGKVKENDSELLKQFSKDPRKMTPKMKKDLLEIEGMMKEMKSLGDGLKNMKI